MRNPVDQTKANALKAALQAELNGYLNSRVTFYSGGREKSTENVQLKYISATYSREGYCEAGGILYTSRGNYHLTASRGLLILSLSQKISAILDGQDDSATKLQNLQTALQTAASGNTNLTTHYSKTHQTYQQMRDSGVNAVAAFLRALFSCQSQAQKAIERCQALVKRNQGIFAAPAAEEEVEGRQPGAATPASPSAPQY